MPAYANSYGFELHGNAQTVAGMDSTGLGFIENTQADTGFGNGTLTINNSSNYFYNGYLRTSSGNGTLKHHQGRKRHADHLHAAGSNDTGGLTVSGGVLITAAAVISPLARM